jgi:Fur family zinc uptake transcriptional regulator
MSRPLTRNQALVHGALTTDGGPISAYTLLDRLRDDGFRAPLQVYRALDQLMAQGLVHRLESLNAFVACKHPACGRHGVSAFAICGTCGTVSEFTDATVEAQLTKWARGRKFTAEHTTIELRGQCASCTK